MEWHEAQDSMDLCLASCSLIVIAPRMSGSTAAMPSGGLGGGVPKMRSRTQVPRRIGEV